MDLLAIMPFDASAPLITNRALPLLYELSKRGVNVSLFFPYGGRDRLLQRYSNRIKHIFLPSQKPNYDNFHGTRKTALHKVFRFFAHPSIGRLLLPVAGSDELKILVDSFKLLKDFDFDVIYAFKPWLRSAGLALMLNKVSKVLTVLDIDDYDIVSQSPILKGFDAVTVSSRELYKLFSNYNPLYVPNSTDLNLFKPVPQASSSKSIIVWSGIMYEHLRLEDLIIALRKMRMNASLMFLGKGPLRSKLLILAKKLVPNRVFFSPWVERKSMPMLLSRAKVGIVYLSDTLYERCKSPGKMFEYMAMELPVVATDIGEPKYVVNKAKCGILVPPRDPTSLANAFDNLLEDDEMVDQMGKNGRKYLLTRQNYEALSLHLKDLILKLSNN